MTENFENFNLSRLKAELAGMRALLRGERGDPRRETAPSGAPLSMLDRLAACFRLTPFERGVLLLCAGRELEADFAGLYREIQGVDWPNFALALSRLPEAHWSALSPERPLRFWNLIYPGADEPITVSPLYIDEFILHYLCGVVPPDPAFAGLLDFTPSADAGPPEPYADFAASVARAWRASGSSNSSLYLDNPDEGRVIALAVARELELELYTASTLLLPRDPLELERLIRAWSRFAALVPAALYIDARAEHPLLTRFLERASGCVLVAAEERPRAADLLVLDPPRLTTGDRVRLWQAAGVPGALNGSIEQVSQEFPLSARDIQSAARRVAGALGAPTIDPDQTLREAARLQARPHMQGLAERIVARAEYERLVLPDAELERLRSIAMHVRGRGRVYESWGFALQTSRGLGINALFAGPSGTGKTMAAEAVAADLGLDLYRIDLARVVSKYIGETEKHLARLFAAGERAGAILLFDEADALFGKRSEVRDSHDRYANIGISYLLQRMESYRGLSILTTNQPDALDQAFLRRLRFLVRFPFPGIDERERIWRGVWPERTPRGDLDFARLARLNVSGGQIHNIALDAAFRAADADEPVQMHHLLAATRAEFRKLDRVLAEGEISGWVKEGIAR